MALDKILDNLDSVDEDLKGFYTEKDGKFHLEDITGLKNTVNALRNEIKPLKSVKAQVSAWEKLGKTPEEIQALLDAQEEDATKKLREKGDFEALLGQHKNRWEGEKTALSSQVDFWKNKFQNTDRSNSLTLELSKIEATPEGLELLPNILADRIKYDVDGDKISVKILSSDKTTPMAGSGADGQATFTDLVKEAKVKFPSLFKGSGQSGSGASETGDKGGSRAPGNLKRSQMSIPDKTKYIAEHGQDAYLKLPA